MYRKTFYFNIYIYNTNIKQIEIIRQCIYTVLLTIITIYIIIQERNKWTFFMVEIKFIFLRACHCLN